MIKLQWPHVSLHACHVPGILRTGDFLVLIEYPRFLLYGALYIWFHDVLEGTSLQVFSSKPLNSDGTHASALQLGWNVRAPINFLHAHVQFERRMLAPGRQP